MTVPIFTESADVRRVRRDTGSVRVVKNVSIKHALVDQPVYRVHVTVERRTVNRPVSQAPPVRTEGDSVVVPVVEEVLVLEKRLMLREEIWVKRVREVRRTRQRVALRTEEARVERTSIPTRASKAGNSRG